MPQIAIYARKSVFREESVSIESQIELCRYEARGEECAIYQDNGFSGKNTERPDFQKMMKDIMAHRITKVIVYKLDRISRSILDFAEMMEMFRNYGVDFVSATEKFDTSSPMGRAMLNICIVFAQLERETIQQRVADAYLSRSKKGLYMGGRIPYGFTKIPIEINGIRSSMYQTEPEEAEDIRLIYELYSKPSATLGDVLRELCSNGNMNKRGKLWNTARLSELMRNPVYVAADVSVYNFFKQQSTNICSPIEDFNGKHGCYLFSGSNTNRKTWDLHDRNLVVAPHSGFIDSDVWLICRKKLLANHQIKTCKAKNSWLSGLVKCGSCGYAMTIKRSKTKAGRYFYCSGRANKVCSADIHTVYADVLEEQIKCRIGEKLDRLSIRPKNDKSSSADVRIAELQALIDLKDEKINALINKFAQADVTTVNYINKTVQELDTEKRQFMDEIDRLRNSENNTLVCKELHNVISKWNDLSFDEKRAVANLLIEKVAVFPDRVEIHWKV